MREPLNRRHGGQPGLAVDSHGGAVIDPTKNVLDLVDSAVTRLDDMAALRAELNNEKITRMEREVANLDKLAALREQHNQAMRESESRRVDANRATDLAAVGTAAAQALAGIQTLAATAMTTADTLRNQVAATATAAESRLAAFGGDIGKRLSALELSSSEGKGKQTVSDPQMERLATIVEALARNDAQGSGKIEGISASWGFAIALVGLLAVLYTFSSRATPAAQPPIYLQAPAGTMLPSTPTTSPAPPR